MIWSAVACAAAAGLAALWMNRDRDPLPGPGQLPGPEQIVEVEPSRPAVPSLDLSSAPPSLLAYHRALAESDRVLDGLLDRHASTLLAATPDPLAP